MRSHPHIHRSLRPTDDRTRDLLTQLCEFPILACLTTSNSCNRPRHRFREHLERGSQPGITWVMGAKCPRRRKMNCKFPGSSRVGFLKWAGVCPEVVELACKNLKKGGFVPCIESLESASPSYMRYRQRRLPKSCCIGIETWEGWREQYCRSGVRIKLVDHDWSLVVETHWDYGNRWQSGV